MRRHLFHMARPEYIDHMGSIRNALASLGGIDGEDVATLKCLLNRDPLVFVPTDVELDELDAGGTVSHAAEVATGSDNRDHNTRSDHASSDSGSSRIDLSSSSAVVPEEE